MSATIRSRDNVCPCGVAPDPGIRPGGGCWCSAIDDEMIERAASAWPLPGPPIGDDFEQHMRWRRECAELVLRAGLGGSA